MNGHLFVELAFEGSTGEFHGEGIRGYHLLSPRPYVMQPKHLIIFQLLPKVTIKLHLPTDHL